MALTLALSVLVVLTVPMLALFSMTALEPVVARNLADAMRALYAAESGMEWALTLLVETPDGELMLPGVAETAPLAPPPGLVPWGRVTIAARREPSPPRAGGSATTTGSLVLTSTATVNGAGRSIEVAVRPAAPTPDGSAARRRVVTWRER